MSLRTARRRRRCCCGGGCVTTLACGTITLPVAWRLEVGTDHLGSGETLATDPPGDCSGFCALFAGGFYLLHRDVVGWDAGTETWLPITPTNCAAHAVFADYPVQYDDAGEAAAGWRLKIADGANGTYAEGSTTDLGVWRVEFVVQGGDPTKCDGTLTVRMCDASGWQELVYEATDLPLNVAGAGSIVFTRDLLIENSCNLPETLTLTPAASQAMRPFAGCACVLTANCCSNNLGIGFKLTAGEVGSASPAGDCDTCCGHLSGEFWLIHALHLDGQVWGYSETGIEARAYEPATPNTYVPDDLDAGVSCGFGAAQFPETKSEDGGYLVKQYICTDPCETDQSSYHFATDQTTGYHPAWALYVVCREPGTANETVQLVAVGSVWNQYAQLLPPGIWWAPLAYGQYETAEMTPAALATALAGGAVTLNLRTVTNGSYSPSSLVLAGPPWPSPYGCDFPATVAVETVSETIRQMMAGCHHPCTPPFETTHGILRLDGSIGGGTVVACLAESFDEETGEFTYEGSGLIDGGACDGDQVDFLIYCASADANGFRRWVMDVTGPLGTQTVDLEIVVVEPNPPTATASDTLTVVCGSTLFAADIQDCAGDILPFFDCFTDGAVFACCFDGAHATGSFHDGNCGGCTTSSEEVGLSTNALDCGGTSLESLLTGFVAADGYLIGPLPANNFFGDWTGWKVLLWCDGGTLRSAVLDGSNCPQWDGFLVSSSSESLAAVFSYSEPIFDCCEDSFGEFRITFG